ncbi:MAG TPA: succinylglutamate desuccinylase/aspartoacylase family protein [Candidatus Dormibacteraeota bacterium]
MNIANGHRLELHIHELKGAQPGPTLGLVGGIHGDEPLSIEIIREVLETVDPAGLRGSLVALPVANPYALQTLTRNTPIDMNNLNRVFPGDPDGMLTEQLAHTICTEFLPRCQYLVDLHAGGNLATVDYVYIHDDDEDLSRAFGVEVLFRGPSFPGSFANHAREQGIPSVVSELGGGQKLSSHFRAKGVRGITNVMKRLGMIDGEPELPAEQVVVSTLVTLRPHQGGLLYPEVSLDQLTREVPKGTVLGRVVSPYTFETLETITAPFDRSILVLLREHVTKVDAGDYGFMVADADSAEERKS